MCVCACVCVCQLAFEERRELDIAAATGLCILQKRCIETASSDAICNKVGKIEILILSASNIDIAVINKQ